MSSNRQIRVEQSLTVAIFLGGFTLGVLTFLFPLNMPTEKVSINRLDDKSYVVNSQSGSGSYNISSNLRWDLFAPVQTMCIEGPNANAFML